MTDSMPAPDPELRDFVVGLPKAELHVHHVGSASPTTVAKLAARREGRSPVPADPDALAEYFRFRDFAHFVDVFLSVMDLITTAEDLRLLTYEVAQGLADQHVRYAEVTVTPYSHTVRGIEAEAVCEAIEDARVAAERDLGILLRWCFDIPGESGMAAADETLAIALGQRPDGLVSFGLGGPEIGVPRPQFAPHFDAARAAGLRSVPHAGETTGPQTIWHALEHLGAERIGHGVSAVEDPRLVEHLAEHEIHLEVCPTSNLRTGAVESLEEHPLPTLVAAGVPVSINSDDPPMFGTTLAREYLVAAELLGLDQGGLAALASSAVEAAFLPTAEKRRLLDEIATYAASRD